MPDARRPHASEIHEQKNRPAIAEMLIQSHAGYIELLPAIPDNWKASGTVKGLKARGNFTVDITWKEGKVIHYRIASAQRRPVKVKVNGVVKEIVSQPYSL